MLLQLPLPAVQFTVMHLQGAGYLCHFWPPFRRVTASCSNSLLNFFRDFIFQLSPFNDFQGLTGCLKNGVRSMVTYSAFP